MNVSGSEAIVENTKLVLNDIETVRAKVNNLFATFTSKVSSLLSQTNHIDNDTYQKRQLQFIGDIATESNQIRTILANIKNCSKETEDRITDYQNKADEQLEHSEADPSAFGPRIAEEIPRDIAHSFASEIRWKEVARWRARKASMTFRKEQSQAFPEVKRRKTMSRNADSEAANVLSLSALEKHVQDTYKHPFRVRQSGLLTLFARWENVFVVRMEFLRCSSEENDTMDVDTSDALLLDSSVLQRVVVLGVGEDARKTLTSEFVVFRRITELCMDAIMLFKEQDNVEGLALVELVFEFLALYLDIFKTPEGGRPSLVFDSDRNLFVPQLDRVFPKTDK